MAKKSAMSKGYRKTVKQKPFLSKKEIIALVVIVAAILIGLVLFNTFYDDGYLGADEVQSGDIVSHASTELRDRYKKIGTIGELEGFTLEEREADATLVEPYTFLPEGEVDNVTTVSVSGSFVNAPALTLNTLNTMVSLGLDPEGFSDVQEVTVQGYKAYAFTHEYSKYVEEETDAAAEAETETVEAETAEAETAEEPAHNHFSQSVSTYVEIDEGRTLCLYINREGSDDSFYLADEEIADYIQKYTTAFVLPVEEAA